MSALLAAAVSFVVFLVFVIAIPRLALLYFERRGAA